MAKGFAEGAWEVTKIVGDCLWTGVKVGVLHDETTIRRTEFGKIGSAAGYVSDAAFITAGGIKGAQLVVKGIRSVGKKVVSRQGLRFAGKQ